MTDENIEKARLELLRAELEDFELEEEDQSLLNLELSDEEFSGYIPAPPVLAIVGRPNVGKSALVNILSINLL